MVIVRAYSGEPKHIEDRINAVEENEGCALFAVVGTYHYFRTLAEPVAPAEQPEKET